jgi:phosphopantothenoylcysteine synthetase/decarboxylase
MAGNDRQPVLYVVACGGRPAGDLPAFVSSTMAEGWDVCVIATPAALKFMDTEQLAELTGHVVRYAYKQPDEPDVLPPPDALAVAPATFNTINKWAYGISDTLALGLLNEAIGLGLPIVAVPVPNVALAKHPAFRESVQRLRSWEVRLIFDPDRYLLPTPNMGPPAAGLFPWGALASEVRGMKEKIGKTSAPEAP